MSKIIEVGIQYKVLGLPEVHTAVLRSAKEQELAFNAQMGEQTAIYKQHTDQRLRIDGAANSAYIKEFKSLQDSRLEYGQKTSAELKAVELRLLTEIREESQRAEQSKTQNARDRAAVVSAGLKEELINVRLIGKERSQQEQIDKRARDTVLSQEVAAQKIADKEKAQSSKLEEKAAATANKETRREALAQFKNYDQLEVQYHGVKTKQLVKENNEFLNEKLRVHQKSLQGATQEIREEAALREKAMVEELKGRYRLQQQRQEVMHGGAAAIMGQLGIGRNITDLFGATSVTGAIGAGIGMLGGAETLKHLAETGIETVKTTEHLKTAFEAAGVASTEMNRAMHESDALAEQLSDRWNVYSERVKQVQTYVAQMGRVVGDANLDITKMSLAVEESTKDFGENALSAEQFSKVFNVQDPEREVYLGRLKMKYRDLAEALTEAKNTGEALTIAHQYLQPVMVEVEKRARAEASAWDEAANKGKEFWKLISEPVGHGLLTGLQAVGAYLRPGGTIQREFEEMIQQTDLFKTRLTEISKFKHTRIDIDDAFNMSEKAFAQMKLAEQYDDDIYGKAVDVPDLVAPQLERSHKTIEEINRAWLAKQKEKLDGAAADEIATVTALMNREVLTQQQGRARLLRDDVEYNRQIADLSKGRVGLENDRKTALNKIITDESEIYKLGLDAQRVALQEQRQMWTEGVSFMRSEEEIVHAGLLDRINELYDQRLLTGKEYQRLILEQNRLFAKQQLKDAGGDATLVREGKSKLASAEHAIRQDDIRKQADDERDARARQLDEERTHWERMKEVVDAGVGAAFQPLNTAVEKNVQLMVKDGNVFLQWAADFGLAVEKILAKKAAEGLEDLLLGPKPNKDNVGISQFGPGLSIGSEAQQSADLGSLLKKAGVNFYDDSNGPLGTNGPMVNGKVIVGANPEDWLVNLSNTPGMQRESIGNENIALGASLKKRDRASDIRRRLVEQQKYLSEDAKPSSSDALESTAIGHALLLQNSQIQALLDKGMSDEEAMSALKASGASVRDQFSASMGRNMLNYAALKPTELALGMGLSGPLSGMLSGGLESFGISHLLNHGLSHVGGHILGDYASSNLVGRAEGLAEDSSESGFGSRGFAQYLNDKTDLTRSTKKQTDTVADATKTLTLFTDTVKSTTPDIATFGKTVAANTGTVTDNTTSVDVNTQSTDTSTQKAQAAIDAGKTAGKYASQSDDSALSAIGQNIGGNPAGMLKLLGMDKDTANGIGSGFQIASSIAMKILPFLLSEGSGPIYAAKGYGPRGTDTIPAWLTPGEGVATRSAMQKYPGVVQEMNSGRYMPVSHYTIVHSQQSRPGMGRLHPEDMQTLAQHLSVAIAANPPMISSDGMRDSWDRASLKRSTLQW